MFAPFLRPALLWGLLAVAIPLLVHLLGRRKVRAVPIATLRFLERARARATARWRLRRLLLLATRAAALAGLALLFAGPGCQRRGGAAGPVNWVLLLDTSPSMASVAGGASCLDRAKARLKAVVDAAGPSDRFLLATTKTGREAGWSDGFTADASSVGALVRETRIEYGEHRIDRALERALRLLKGAGGGRVVLASDLQASAWPPGSVQRAGSAPIEVLDLALPTPKNVWAAAVEASEDALAVGLAGSGVPDGTRRTVRLRLSDGQTATAFVTGSEASFRLRFPPGPYTGSVRVEPGGDLLVDDELFFASRGASATQVLLVNGDPRDFLIRDELFFVRRALAPGGKLGRTFRTREVRAADLSPRDLQGVDVLFLANPGRLSEPVAAALRASVEAGAGLVVTSGDRWERAGAGPVGALLPAPLRDVVDVGSQGGARRPYELLDPEFFQGAMVPFRARSAGDLSATRVWNYRVLDPRGSEGAAALMRLDNGAPLLVDRPLGKGRSVLLTTTIDRDGADLCLQPGFLPWLERLLLHAAGRLEPRAPSPVTAGEPVALPYSSAAFVQGPEGERAGWRPGTAYVPARPGLYKVLGPGGELDAFAARIDPAESDLTRLGPEEVKARLGPPQPAAVPRGAEGRVRSDVSTELAWVLVALLAAEAVLSGRARRRVRGSEALHEDLHG